MNRTEQLAVDLALRKLSAEADTAELNRQKAEVELETAKLVREYVREAQRATNLPSFKVS